MMRESMICQGRDCHIDVQPSILHADGSEAIGTRVIHWSEPVWYTYVNPAMIDADGMIAPEEQRRLCQIAEDMHEEERRARCLTQRASACLNDGTT